MRTDPSRTHEPVGRRQLLRIGGLGTLGLTLPGATDFYWQVYGLSPFTDINDVASSDKMGALFALRRSGSIAESDYREFTTR